MTEAESELSKKILNAQARILELEAMIKKLEKRLEVLESTKWRHEHAPLIAYPGSPAVEP